MKELVEFIVKSLVDHPEQVVVTEEIRGEDHQISVNVAPDDMGKVIGKQGRIAKAIRTVVKSAAIKSDIQVSVEIGE
ncbi:MAG: KH domain-containing protein [Lachnospiraceae bacterium]|nr:KH domain-containing protein [Lachnospiraceae bacterium]